MYSKECMDLSLYRLSKAEQYLEDAKRTLELKICRIHLQIVPIMRFFMLHAQFWRLMDWILRNIPE